MVMQSADNELLTDNSPDELTGKETRQVVTPYAFFVSDELLGTPLARPFRRGFALLIDLFFVALLTQVSSLILATVAAGTFFRAGNRLKTKKRFNGARIFLRLLVAVLLFLVARGIIEEMNANNHDPSFTAISKDEVKTLDLVSVTAKNIGRIADLHKQLALGECEPAYDCIASLGSTIVSEMTAEDVNQDIIQQGINVYISAFEENINTEQTQQLLEELTLQANLNLTLEDEVVDIVEPFPTKLDQQIAPDKTDTNMSPVAANGMVAWLKNLVEELGLGFGWAAFYFSVFTAWWKGQTPGKKIMGIKVIKLDNQTLNLWESFGRYGGYGAGLATGLLGFLQVFWDPNRQGIQDKISETLVIDLRKPKMDFVRETVE